MSFPINTYSIQEWLFDEAEGKFDIDLAESGIQYHYFHDLDLSKNVDLNYSLDRGNKVLRKLVSGLYGRDETQVVITHGAQEGLYLIYRSLLKANDHVITFTPGWQQSWEVPAAIGCTVSCIKVDGLVNYEITKEALEASIQPNTKMVSIINPCNPTGKSLSKKEVALLIDFCQENNLFLICDEEYCTDYASSLIHQYEKSAVVSGLSKVYGFPGLRTGWVISSAQLIEKLVNYKRYVTVSNSSLCEYLAIQVIESYKKHIEHYFSCISKGKRLTYEFVREHSQFFGWLEPDNTPFVYLQLKQFVDAQEFSRQLLRDQAVLVMPSQVFDGVVPAIRVSFGREEGLLQEGFSRISTFLTSAAVMRDTAVV